MWIDPPEYYDPPGPGVLAFEPELPPSLVRPEGGMDTRAHTALLPHPNPSPSPSPNPSLYPQTRDP